MSRVENMFVTGETPPASAQTSFKAKVTPAQTVTFPAATEAAAEAAADLRATVKDAFATAGLKITGEAEPAPVQRDQVVTCTESLSDNLAPRRIFVRMPWRRGPVAYIREDLAAPQPAPLDTFRLSAELARVIREAVEAAYRQASDDVFNTYEQRRAAEERERIAAARADRLARALDILPTTEG